MPETATPALSPAVLDAAHAWRYATKGFDPARKIPADHLAALERSLIAAPSSFGLQPWKFLVISDPALRAKLREKAWNQPQLTDCSHFVVIATKTQTTPADVEKLIDATYAARGIPAGALDGYKGMMLGFLQMPGIDHAAWNAKQGYIALGFLLQSAALLGIDACPMEGFDHAAFDELLGLKGTGYTSAVTAALGYRAAGDKYATAPKVRYSAVQLIWRK